MVMIQEIYISVELTILLSCKHHITSHFNNHWQTSEYKGCNNYWQHTKFQSLVHAMDSNKQGLQIEFCSDITRLIHWRLNPLRASLKGLHILAISYKGNMATVANCYASCTISKGVKADWLATRLSTSHILKTQQNQKNKLYSIITYNISTTNGYKCKHKEENIMR